jgi:Tol biopolymer transport system component
MMTTTRRCVAGTLAILLAGCGNASATSGPTATSSESGTPAAAASVGPVASSSPLQTVEPTTPIPTPTASPRTNLPSQGRIAFNLSAGPSANISTNILTVEPNGKGLKALTHLSVGCERDSAWSPNGKRIIFGIGVPATIGCDDSTSQYLASMDANGKSVHRLTSSANGVFDDGEAVSPDGAKIAFSRFDISGKLTGIWLMNADGSHLVRVTTTPAEASAGGDQSPAFSPDGSKIVFARDGSDNSNGSIYVVGIDGSGLRQVVPEALDAAGPSFSPDGSQILFSNLDSVKPSNVYVVNADGSGVRKLTNEASSDGAGGAAWSPDGTLIVFINYHAGDNFFSLTVMGADGTAPTVIWHPTPKTDNFPEGPTWGTAP